MIQGSYYKGDMITCEAKELIVHLIGALVDFLLSSLSSAYMDGIFSLLGVTTDLSGRNLGLAVCSPEGTQHFLDRDVSLLSLTPKLF